MRGGGPGGTDRVDDVVIAEKPAIVGMVATDVIPLLHTLRGCCSQQLRLKSKTDPEASCCVREACSQ